MLCHTAVVLVRRRSGEGRSPLEVRAAVIGNVDSGKSTLVGVLTRSMLDDGRGLARGKVRCSCSYCRGCGRCLAVCASVPWLCCLLSAGLAAHTMRTRAPCWQVFKHHHEEATGRTSSIGQHNLCMVRRGSVVLQPVTLLAASSAPLCIPAAGAGAHLPFPCVQTSSPAGLRLSLACSHMHALLSVTTCRTARAASSTTASSAPSTAATTSSTPARSSRLSTSQVTRRQGRLRPQLSAQPCRCGVCCGGALCGDHGGGACHAVTCAHACGTPNTQSALAAVAVNAATPHPPHPHRATVQAMRSTSAPPRTA